MRSYMLKTRAFTVLLTFLSMPSNGAEQELYRELASIKPASTYTYSGLKIENSSIKINRIKQFKNYIQIDLTKKTEDGFISARSQVCTSPGFFSCKGWSSYLFRIDSDNQTTYLNKINNFEIRPDVFNKLIADIDEERGMQSRDRSRAEYILTQLISQLSSYRKSEIIVDSEGGDGILELSFKDLASNKISLYFPYNGTRLSSFDLSDGTSGTWNVNGIRLPDLSDEELGIQSKILKILNKNKEYLSSLSDESLKELTSRYKKYDKVSEWLSEITLTNISNSNDELRLTQILNNNANNMTIVKPTLNKLRTSLLNKHDLKLYNSVFNILDPTINGLEPIANDMTKLILEMVIKPSKDLNNTIEFIKEFHSASGDVISDAYDVATKLESDNLHSELDKLISENKGQLSKFDAEERLARRLYIEAIQAKENNDEIRFAIKYYIATNDEIFKETESAFNLYRDKEMKDFFKIQFDNLNQTQKEATSEIIESMHELSNELTKISNNTSPATESDEVSYQQNQKFLMQQLVFDRLHRGD